MTLVGDAVDGPREIDPSDFVLVKVRWKDLGATETDPAHETSATLTPADIAAASAADDDMAWAAAIAAFAEILKDSPFGDEADLARIDAIVTPQASRDADRGRFVSLFGTARTLMGR